MLPLLPYISFIIYGTFKLSDFNREEFIEERRKYPQLEIFFYKGTKVPLDIVKEGPIASLLKEQNPEACLHNQEATTCFIFKGYLNQVGATDLRDILLSIAAIALHPNSISVVDLTTLQIFLPEEFYKESEMISIDFFNAVRLMYVPEEPSSPEAPSSWLYTRGMIKLGLPDLSLHHVSEERLDTSLNIFETLTYFLENNQSPLQKPEKKVEFHFKINKRDVFIVASLQGSKEDPVFNNVYFELEPKFLLN